MLRTPRCTASGLGLFALVLGAVTACGPTSTDTDLPTTSPFDLAAARLAPDVAQGLAAVRNATAAYHDVAVAIAAGYGDPTGLPCVASPAGTMGMHSVRAGPFDQAVVPNEPEILLYLPKKGGGVRLVAVEYLVPVLVLKNEPGATPTPWFSHEKWDDAEYTVLTPQPSVFGSSFEGPMAGHEPGMPWHYDKHVWIWETNPNGIFSQWNPSISCS